MIHEQLMSYFIAVPSTPLGLPNGKVDKQGDKNHVTDLGNFV
jgi:hypothetical protein